MANSYSQLLPLLAAIALFSPVAASVCAVAFYARHSNPQKRISLVAYVLVLLVCAIVAFFVGLQYGIAWACSSPSAGNLCGLAGFFIIGPVASAFAIFFAAALMTLSPRA